MQAVGKWKLIFILFVLSIGKGTDALKEFNRIKGEWIVVRTETRGEMVSTDTQAKTVIFLSSKEPTKQPENSMAFSGELKLGRSRNLFKLSTVSVLMEIPPGDATPAQPNLNHPAKPRIPIKQPQKSYAIYQITGDTMKLLMKPAIGTDMKPPTSFVTTKEGGELLLELRRSPKKMP